MNQETIKEIAEAFVSELLMMQKYKNQFIIACLVAILVFAAVSCFFKKLHIQFAIPFFGLFFLHMGWTIFCIESISSASISSYAYLGIHFMIGILWFCFALYIGYQIFARVWEGVYFIVLIVLNLLLAYLQARHVTSINQLLKIFNHMNKENIMLSLLYIICIISILFIMISLYWNISRHFCLGSTKTIEKTLQIGLFVLFIWMPIVPMCLIGLLPFSTDGIYEPDNNKQSRQFS